MVKTARAAFAVAAFFGPVYAAANPTVYVPLGEANKVIAIDAQTDELTEMFSGVRESHGLVATPDGEYLVAGSLEAGLNEDNRSSSNLYLVHPAHGHVMATFPIEGPTHHQAITPDGRYVLSTHAAQGNISVFDLAANEVTQRVKTGPGPNSALITSDGRRAYVSNSGDGTIAEIDLVDWTPRRTFEAGSGPEHIVFSADEETIYAANPRAGEVSAVHIATGELTRTYKVGGDVHGLGIGDDGHTLFVSSPQDRTVTALNTETGVQRSVDLDSAPYHLDTITGTGKVYVSSRQDSAIWALDQETLETVATIDLPGGAGHQMAVVRK